MTRDEKRVVIAKFDGWKWCSFWRQDQDESFPRKAGDGKGKGDFNLLSRDGTFNGTRDLPDYFNDLNAIASVVAKLRYPKTQTLWSKNQKALEGIVARRVAKDSVSFKWECQNATAEERSEALVVTIGKLI